MGEILVVVAETLNKELNQLRYGGTAGVVVCGRSDRLVDVALNAETAGIVNLCWNIPIQQPLGEVREFFGDRLLQLCVRREIACRAVANPQSHQLIPVTGIQRRDH